MGQTATDDALRSEALGPGRLGRLRALHEGMHSDLSRALSDLLRCAVEARLVGVDQMAYGEFLADLQSPSCFTVLKAQPLDDRVMLDIEPSILYPMIDRLLGGRGDEPPPGRPLSDIELPLAARITRLFLHHLQVAWAGVLEFGGETFEIESNPRLLRVLPADEAVVQVAFQLNVGDLQGMARLCVPCRAIERMGERYRQDAAHGTSELIEVAVSLATTPISVAELNGLRAGDVILTEAAIGSPAIVSIAGEAKFHAQPGVCEGRKAVRLTEAIEDAP